MTSRNVVGGRWSWLVVVVAGAVVLTLVFGLSLFSRLGAGQELIDGLSPAFTDARVAGDVAAIGLVSVVVDMADPIMTAEGGAAAEVPALVGFVSDQTGLTSDEVLGALQANFPHTTGLLLALPLEEVSAEIPLLVTFLSETIGISEDEVLAALDANFPNLKQAIDNLPLVTAAWNDAAGVAPGVGPLTRFDGTNVATVPDIREYFAADVIAAVGAQKDNFQTLEPTPVGQIPIILTVIGVIAVVYGLLMLVMSRRGEVQGRSGVLAWSVVTAVGVLVLVIVGGLQLYPRLDAGQEVLDGVRPAFTDARVAGDVAAIGLVSVVVDMADPIMTAEGGAAAEVPALVGFVSDQTGLTSDEVLGALQANFPHTTGLLLALPLEEVSAEIPLLVTFLSETIGISEDEVLAALDANFPNLKQAIDNLPLVTAAWNDAAGVAPGVGPLTRFDGTNVATVPDIREYFAADVIAAVGAQKDNFQELDGTDPQVNWFPFLLTILGAIVVTYGVAMMLIVRRPLSAAVGGAEA